MARYFIGSLIRSLLLATALVAGCSDGEVNFATVKLCVKFTTGGTEVGRKCGLTTSIVSIDFKPGLRFKTDKNASQTAAPADADQVRISYKGDPTAGPTVSKVEFFDTTTRRLKAKFLSGDSGSPLLDGTKQVDLTYPTGTTGEITAAYGGIAPAGKIDLPAAGIDDAHIFPDSGT